MLSSILLTGTLLVASAVAGIPGGWNGWPGKGGPGGPGAPNCLDDAEVKTLIDGYTYILQSPGGPDFNATANRILSDKYFVSSDSINTLSGIPLGVNAYPNKQALILGQYRTPPIPLVQTLGTFYSCNQISWRWNASGIGSNQYRVNGMITFDVNTATNQIDAVYSEFNTASWFADIGNPECKK